jgi:signal peptidase I
MVSLVAILSLFVIYVLLVFTIKMKPKVYKTVSAGDSNKNFSSTIELRTNIYQYNLISKKKEINPAKYDIYVVIGDSMRYSRINDRDFVLVEKLKDNDKYTIKPGNVLLLEIDKSKDSGQSDNVEFKLRKHISYIDNTSDFDTWIAKLPAEIFVQKEHIRAKYEECIGKYKQNNSDTENFTFTFSSTHDELGDEVKYSFHPIKFLNGIVCYSVKNKDILK